MTVQRLFQHVDQCTLANAWYREQVRRYIVAAIASDAKQDVTSAALIPRTKKSLFRIVARESGVVAGLTEVAWALQQFHIAVKIKRADGKTVKRHDVIAELSGSTRTILAVERTALNTLQHLSGVATATKLCAHKLGSSAPTLAATRKTLFGALDKRAVALGGGVTHRLNLFDGGLIKDNHLEVIGGIKALPKFFLTKRIPWEVEVDTIAQFKQLLKLELPIQAVLLDNFTPGEIVRALTWAKTFGYHKDLLFEASGGITLENVQSYGKTGVNVISLGSLTHSVTALDLSLE